MNVRSGSIVPKTFMAINYAKTAVALALVLLIFPAVCTIQAADTDNFYTQSLVPDAKILTIVPLQFDGVGADELAMAVRSEQGGIRLLVYRESIPRNYESKPALAVDVPASVFGLQAVDMDGDNRTEIALLGLENLYVVDFDEGGFAAIPKELAKFERLYAVPRPDFIVEYEFLFDLNNDRNFDAVLPSWDGIRIMKRDRTGFAAGRLVKINHGSIANLGTNLLAPDASCGLAMTLPTIGAFDLNTDRAKDIAVASGSGLAVCFQVGDFQFAETPNQLLEVRAAFLDNLRFMSWGFGDLNNDKVTDYCRVFTQGSQDEFKTVIEIYLASGQSGFAQRPSKRIVLDQYCVGLNVADLNGDGTAAAIVATVAVSSTSLVKSLLVKRMQVDLNVFQAEGGVLTEQASSIKRISCAVDFFGGDVPTRLVGCLHGDFDKDKMKELVSINDDDEIEIFKGAKNPQFSDKPMLIRQTQRCNWLETSDLNLDGKADLILQLVDETGRDLTTLLWSK